ncbi:MAG: protein phosphatase 1 regulatory subunit 42 [Candidatus Goldbacteria bacterium]|nr:protein phosphatase 1 regulatory subunit 42 [Candidatus Goldiibacteriota bacterium]
MQKKETTPTSPAPTSTPINTPIPCSGVINFPDSNLENIIRQAIGKPSGDIYASDLAGLTSLDASSSNITNITGLQCCTNLQSLDLSYNNISDINALSGLSNLQSLYLSSNNISDINALSGLTNLQWLNLSSNYISDITALVTNCDKGGLGSGDFLYLNNNPLSSQAINTDIPFLQSKGVNIYY